MTPAIRASTSAKRLDATLGMRFRWVRRTEDIHALARCASDEVHRLSHEAIQDRGVFRIALAGGSTPRTLYEIISRSTTMCFDKWHVYWGDERYVPPTHKNSNFLMSQETLLGRIGLEDRQIHRIRTEVGTPDQVAADYENELRYSFDLQAGERPSFDLVLLGLGDDGHTASLFPHTAALADTQRLVVPIWSDESESYRITLTASTINASRAVIFLVSGRAKSRVLRDVLDGDGPADELPARLICPRMGTCLWVVDEAAHADSGKTPSELPAQKETCRQEDPLPL
jgi:6-phosphogluconolactonase